MNRIKLLSIRALVCAALLAASCSDDNDGNSIAVYQNVVTFTGNQPEGARFEFQEADDSPAVVLGVSGHVNEEKVKPGTRLLMIYSLPEGYSYGHDCMNVVLRGLQTIYTATITPLPHTEAVAANAPIYLNTIYRTGHYINVTASMPALTGRSYTLAADETTLGTSNVEAYLTTSTEEEKPMFNENQTLSIDISPVWEMAQTKNLTIHINNINNKYLTSVTFSKTINN